MLQAELIKLRTTRMFLALASIAIAISMLLAGLVAVLTEPTADSVLVDVFQSDTSSLFILLLAIVGISGEWRHRTITSSLLAAPDRLRFLTAKTLAFAVAGLLLSLAVSIGVTGLGLAILELRDLPTPQAGDLLDLWWHNAIVAGLLGAFGVAIGALVRNQAVAIVGVLIVAFAVEPALLAIAPDVGRFGPLNILPTAVADIDPEALGVDVELLSPGLAVLAMLAWIGAGFSVAAALLQRRDLT